MAAQLLPPCNLANIFSCLHEKNFVGAKSRFMDFMINLISYAGEH